MGSALYKAPSLPIFQVVQECTMYGAHPGPVGWKALYAMRIPYWPGQALHVLQSQTSQGGCCLWCTSVNLHYMQHPFQAVWDCITCGIPHTSLGCTPPMVQSWTDWGRRQGSSSCSPDWLGQVLHVAWILEWLAPA